MALGYKKTTPHAKTFSSFSFRAHSAGNTTYMVNFAASASNMKPRLFVIATRCVTGGEKPKFNSTMLNLYLSVKNFDNNLQMRTIISNKCYNDLPAL